MKERTINILYFIVLIIAIFMVIVVWIILAKEFYSDLHKMNYCNGIGYTYLRSVGDKFNCCKYSVELIDNKYVSKEVCIAGK